MRQKLIIIESEELHEYNIPQLYFDENIIIIVYKEFTGNLFRYVHMPRIFLISDEIYNRHKSDQYRITDTQIVYNDTIVVDNVNVTYNGRKYFPLVDFAAEEKYLEHFNEQSLDGVEDIQTLAHTLSNIEVPVNNFDNLEARLDRLSDFGNPDLAEQLRTYIDKNREAFYDAASLSIQFYDPEDIQFKPFKIRKHALYVKLNNRVYVYKWDGYSTYIDTLTRFFLHTRVMDNVKIFTEHYTKHKPVVVVSGIINYHTLQNIHEKTNVNDSIYNMLLREMQ